jgi:hypothetical protein
VSIAIGLGLLAVILTDVGGEVFLGAVGLGFLIAYAATRNYGLLIPGAIITGLALGIGAPRWERRTLRECSLPRPDRGVDPAPVLGHRRPALPRRALAPPHGGTIA